MICERLENRLDNVRDHLDRLGERRARLVADRDEAVADGDARKVQRLDAQLAQVDRAQARLVEQANSIENEWYDLCAPNNPE